MSRSRVSLVAVQPKISEELFGMCQSYGFKEPATNRWLNSGEMSLKNYWEM